MVIHEPKTIVPLYLVHLLRDYTVFLECAHAYSPIMRFLCAVHDVQCIILRNHLKTVYKVFSCQSFY